jgi:hypothetical protein
MFGRCLRESLIATMPGRDFSCWRYLEVSRNEMRRDLGLLDDYINGNGQGPAVFANSDNELLLN